MVHSPGYLIAAAPTDEIYDFKGVYRSKLHDDDEEALSLENTIWANTVLASPGFMLGMVIHTGLETRMAMNTNPPRQKVGKLDEEVNWMSKVLFVGMVVLAGAIITVDGFKGDWYFKFFRVILLLCSIIPISMKINLDLAKIYYSYGINRDPGIEGCIARNSTIPEELGRLQFLLTDKTGTLTQNEMIFQKIARSTSCFMQCI